jgi:uncharacterized repeat protein (TIGR03803 family)
MLYNFEYGGDGDAVSGVVLDEAGNIYGTEYSFTTAALPTVFEVDPAGKLTTLESFTGENGYTPSSGVILNAAGNLFGMTSNGGKGGNGVVYRLIAGQH